MRLGYIEFIDKITPIIVNEDIEAFYEIIDSKKCYGGSHSYIVIIDLLLSYDRLDMFKIFHNKFGDAVLRDALSRFLYMSEEIPEKIALYSFVRHDPYLNKIDSNSYTYRLLLGFFQSGNFKAIKEMFSLKLSKQALNHFRSYLKYEFYGGLTENEYRSMLSILSFFLDKK
jgi:hypothetical protein